MVAPGFKAFMEAALREAPQGSIQPSQPSLNTLQLQLLFLLSVLSCAEN